MAGCVVLFILNTPPPPRPSGRSHLPACLPIPQAYAAVAAVESQFLISRGLTYSTYPIQLSVQQVLDCATSLGCRNGGGET